jgi:hypothetical protein
MAGIGLLVKLWIHFAFILVGVLLLMGAIFTDTKPSLIKYPQESMLVG